MNPTNNLSILAIIVAYLGMNNGHTTFRTYDFFYTLQYEILIDVFLIFFPIFCAIALVLASLREFRDTDEDGKATGPWAFISVAIFTILVITGIGNLLGEKIENYRYLLYGLSQNIERENELRKMEALLHESSVK